MTMLNGEPVNTGVPPKSPAAPPAPSRATPIQVGAGADPSNRSIAQIVMIIGVVMAVAVPPVGILMGAIARSMIKPEKSPLTTWAIVLGIIFTVLWLLAVVAFIILMVWTAALTQSVVDSVTP